VCIHARTVYTPAAVCIHARTVYTPAAVCIHARTLYTPACNRNMWNVFTFSVLFFTECSFSLGLAENGVTCLCTRNVSSVTDVGPSTAGM